MITIGVGNTGCKLASSFDDKAILFSTAHQDTVNFSGSYKINVFSEDGCGKKYSTGLSLWRKKRDDLSKILKEFVDEKIVIFSSLGGGSGSSSLGILSEILLGKNNVLICGVLPYKKELNPPLANAVQSINGLVEMINDVSVMLFDNEKLLKHFENDWNKVNSHIVKRVSYVTGLLDSYSIDEYSPVTIDQSELESVVFGGGFIDVSDNFLEETLPKFDYGKIDKDTKNLMVAMFADLSLDKKEVDNLQKTLTEVTNKFATKARNARLVPGILRGRVEHTRAKDPNIKNRAYITIASGLSVDSYLSQIEKIRDDAIERAQNYASRSKVGNVISKKETNILDIWQNKKQII